MRAADFGATRTVIDIEQAVAAIPGSFWIHEESIVAGREFTASERRIEPATLEDWVLHLRRGSANELWIPGGVPVDLITQVTVVTDPDPMTRELAQDRGIRVVLA